jgi:ribonuclease D
MWRIQEANRKQVGPHFILTNQQLINLIKNRPKNIQEIKQIKGIGESKSKEFGESLLGIIHSDNH